MRCTAPGCPWVASALVVRTPPIDARRRGFVLVRPAQEQTAGVPLCVDHAHSALDATLLAALTAPTPPATEQGP